MKTKTILRILSGILAIPVAYFGINLLYWPLTSFAVLLMVFAAIGFDQAKMPKK